MSEIELLRAEIADLRREVADLRMIVMRPCITPMNPIPVIGPGLYPHGKPFWEWRPGEIICKSHND